MIKQMEDKSKHIEYNIFFIQNYQFFALFEYKSLMIEHKCYAAERKIHLNHIYINRKYKKILIELHL